MSYPEAERTICPRLMNPNVCPIAERLVLGTCTPTKGKGPSAGCFFSILVHERALAFDEERAILHNLDPGG